MILQSQTTIKDIYVLICFLSVFLSCCVNTTQKDPRKKVDFTGWPVQNYMMTRKIQLLVIILCRSPCITRLSQGDPYKMIMSYLILTLNHHIKSNSSFYKSTWITLHNYFYVKKLIPSLKLELSHRRNEIHWLFATKRSKAKHLVERLHHLQHDFGLLLKCHIGVHYCRHHLRLHYRHHHYTFHTFYDNNSWRNHCLDNGFSSSYS